MDLKTIYNAQRRFWMILTAAPIIALTISACNDTNREVGPPRDVTAPPVPNGVITTTMDQQVFIEWNAVSMDPSHDDLQGYRIYRSLDNHAFEHISTVAHDVTSYLDQGLTNGTTYFYAISSFDYSGNESELSLDNAFDTPRPEGTITLMALTEPGYENYSGFDFSREIRLRWDNAATNFYLDHSAGLEVFYIVVPLDGSNIQDMGYTANFDEITYAPTTGWSTQGACEAILGHTYVIRTADNHYAKARIVEEMHSPDGMTFDWGYQVDPGNRELKVEPPSNNHTTQATGGSF